MRGLCGNANLISGSGVSGRFLLAEQTIREMPLGGRGGQAGGKWVYRVAINESFDKVTTDVYCRYLDPDCFITFVRPIANE